MESAGDKVHLEANQFQSWRLFQLMGVQLHKCLLGNFKRSHWVTRCQPGTQPWFLPTASLTFQGEWINSLSSYLWFAEPDQRHQMPRPFYGGLLGSIHRGNLLLRLTKYVWHPLCCFDVHFNKLDLPNCDLFLVEMLWTYTVPYMLQIGIKTWNSNSSNNCICL